MQIHCNAGVTTTNQIGDLQGYGTVWYHPEVIATILFLARVKEKYRVTFDSEDVNTFMVHKSDGTQRRFRQSDRGLHYLDTLVETGELMINTVKDN
jgi:hypothetical protein